MRSLLHGQSSEVQIKQTDSRHGRYAAAGAGVGALAGWLLGGPIGDAAVGSIIGALRDRGVDDGFVNDVGRQLKADSSALFLLVKEADGAQAQEELRAFKADVLHTTLTAEQEHSLREGLRHEQ
jgi:uncharacterized membrane protein